MQKRIIRRGAAHLALGLVLMAGVAACSDDESPQIARTGGEETPTTIDDATRRAAVAREGGRTRVRSAADVDQAFQDDVRAAVEATNQFWETHWGDVFGGPYVPPEIKGGYVGAANPPCGGQQHDMSDNAYYCPPDDYIAWDWNLLYGSYADEVIGDSFVYVVMAHEWGHAIQGRAELIDSLLVPQTFELQADCLAGATLTGLVNDGVLEMEPGDRGEIFASFVSVADEYEWGEVGDHGSADQRIEAYQQGENGGLESCFQNLGGGQEPETEPDTGLNPGDSGTTDTTGGTTETTGAGDGPAPG